MEVHTQFGEIRTIKDFLVRLALIVAGVVIAVSVTQCREKNQREALATQMKIRLIAEVSDNSKAVNGALARYEDSKKQLDNAVGVCKSQRDRASPEPKAIEQLDALKIDVRTPSLVSTQWKLTNSNQSIRDFSIEEATQFAGAYSLQEGVEAVFLQHKAPVTSAFVDTDLIRVGASTEEFQRACRAITYLSFYSATAVNNLQLLSKVYSKLSSEQNAAQ